MIENRPDRINHTDIVIQAMREAYPTTDMFGLIQAAQHLVNTYEALIITGGTACSVDAAPDGTRILIPIPPEDLGPRLAEHIIETSDLPIVVTIATNRATGETAQFERHYSLNLIPTGYDWD